MALEKTPGKQKASDITDEALRTVEQVLSECGTSENIPTAQYRTLTKRYKALLRKFYKVITISDGYQAQLKEVSERHDNVSHQLQQLKELLLPICISCKRIRVDEDYWLALETFFSRHIDVMFSHSICPDCLESKYGNIKQDEAFRNRYNYAKEGTTEKRKRSEIPDEDDTLREMLTILNSITDAGNPLAPDFKRFLDKYRKNLRRLNKIVVISDTYQSQLRELNLKLEMVARTDLLTGLSNRWDMMEKLEIEKSRCERHGRNFSIILGDIDHFKAINDTYGHLAGDRVLVEFAQTLRKSLRKEDLCSRWGGEEFLILMPETPFAVAAKVGEKLLEKTRDISVPWEKERIRLTISLGLSEFRRDMSIDECIRSADNALYQAKENGRNRLAGFA